MAAWMVLALSISANLAPPQPPVFSHVRAEDAHVRELVADGARRSPTFRRLLDTVERLPCVVYIVPAVALSHGMTGALLHVATGSPDMPILRVLLKTNLPRAEAIATIGHELQHVTEAVGGMPAGGGLDLTSVFDRLDPRTARTSGVRKYETEAAIAVTGKVRDELRRTRD